MKKISLYFTLAFASLFLVSCNEDFDDWADPQSYLPEEAITIPGFAASATGAIDLANVDTDSVDIFNLTEVALPEGFELGNARVYLVPADIDGAAAVDLKADLQGRVLKSELQSLLENFYGMRPDPRALKATVMLDAVKDGQAVLINAGTIDLNITPAAPVIENTYYLVGSMTGWSDNDTSYPLVNGGGDVYSDPVFNIIIDATGEDIYFKVAPESALGDADFWNKIICAVTEEDDDAMGGSFALGNNGKAFKIPANSAFAQYKISFNMLEYTYTITGIAGGGDIWYLVGGCIGNGSWNNSVDGLGKALIPLMPVAGDPTTLQYVGYFPAGGQFKLIHTPGDWGEQMNYENIANPDASLVSDEDGGNHNIGIKNAGLHIVKVDLPSMSISIAKYNETPSLFTTITMPGDYQGWNAGGNAMDAIGSTENHDWYSKVTFSGDALMKFANGTWDINWGAEDFPAGYGTQGGPNIPVVGGTYHIFFNDITGGYLFVK